MSKLSFTLHRRLSLQIYISNSRANSDSLLMESTILLFLPPHCDSYFHCRGQCSRRAIHLYNVDRIWKEVRLKIMQFPIAVGSWGVSSHALFSNLITFAKCCEKYDIARRHRLEINDKLLWEELAFLSFTDIFPAVALFALQLKRDHHCTSRLLFAFVQSKHYLEST